MRSPTAQSFACQGYDYLRQLPVSLATLREVAYEALLPVAAELLESHKLEVQSSRRTFSLSGLDSAEKRLETLPTTLQEFEDLCIRRGQTRPSNLFLWYQEGGENHEHRDIYGEVSFPLQMVLMLHQEGEDFTGGRFFTKMNGRKHEAAMNRGDLLVFRTACLHGCTPVHRGKRATVKRYVLGLQFALRQLLRERRAKGYR